mmetsp:Transcript_18953/g.36178  ORF Transcript_18953/g.36178 Transcript_18953/m.36178 type:complete len:141 (+) Transcript_18953:1075-1497(+)
MDPRTKPLFAGKAVREQGEKLTAMLETMVNGLSDLEQLKPLIKSLAKRHAHFGVVEDMFPHLGAALNETLQQLLEEKFTAEVEEAWTKMYAMISLLMISTLRDELKSIKRKAERKAAQKAAVAANSGGDGFFASLRLCRG